MTRQIYRVWKGEGGGEEANYMVNTHDVTTQNWKEDMRTRDKVR